ncbi:hypothetical protein PFISCL1PPCAC_1293 [Pristionchus fissidentatus]|uniref:Adenosine 5'-monophosphoramidase HINT3 n=1 Tax=Pristionchus fissidentatus TaxID=1538716 RepID=A0AAV5UU22_9BILA|nr:hypothetical protein PFISCL1PPCAC_1293 [Pristionchus fissidentatus]
MRCLCCVCGDATEVRMSDGVSGCKFCEIARHKKELHLRESENCIVIRDIKPKAPQHFLVIPKVHIAKPTDLTMADRDLLKEMERIGREYLRIELKEKGEADTVEDMLRVGFHWPPMVRVNHLHLHVIYPIKELSFMSKVLTFKPGKVFKTLPKVMEILEKNGNLKEEK